VDAVVVGDLGPAWSFDALNRAFRCVTDGATLVACQRNRYWRDASGLVLDAGPFVAALEFAAGREAVLVGKPSPLFFGAALDGLGLRPGEAVMVGDDAEADAGGAIAAGLAGWLVRTGKYRPGDESRWMPWPECVLDSVAELPAALGIA
jgi:HAD superfamily hydrolase (TIGR01458 family)